MAPWICRPDAGPFDDLRLPVASPCHSSTPAADRRPAAPPALTPEYNATTSLLHSRFRQTTTGRPPLTSILTTLPAAITVGSATWNGTISNLSLGGTCVTLPGNFPTVPLQDAYVIVRTAVGILELQGRAQERSVSLQTNTPASQLIVTFEPPKREEGAVLASLVRLRRNRLYPSPGGLLRRTTAICCGTPPHTGSDRLLRSRLSA